MKFVSRTKTKLIEWYYSIRYYINKDFDDLPDVHSPVNKEDADFVGDVKGAMLAEQTPFIKILLYSLAVFILIAIIWSTFATIEEVTVGSGKVIPSTHVKSIQSLDGGILAELLVKEGQIVKKDQIVARLTVSDFQADYLSTKKHYNALLATLARLEAEASDATSIKFPAEIANQKDLIDNENELFQSRKKGLNERIQTLQASLEIAQKQLNLMQPMVAKGIVSQMEVLQLQANVNNIKGTIKEEQNKFSKEVLTDLNKTQNELTTLKEKMVGLQDRINRSTLRSPVYGIVNQINVTTIGGVLKPGAELMQIVPLEDTLLIEARVNPADIAFIHPGERATVKFTAYDYSIYGSLEGKVEYISADTVLDEKGNTYYLVQVRTNKSYLGTPQKPLPIIPGMVTTVDIITGKKTIASYLLKPLLKAKSEALRER